MSRITDGILDGITGGIGSTIKGVVSNLFPDKAEQDRVNKQFDLALENIDKDKQIAQMKINEAEAKRGGFGSIWRPCVGMVCAASFAYCFIIRDLLVFVAHLQGVDLTGLPAPDFSELWVVLGGMLGLGGGRTLEKIKRAD